MYKHRDFIIWKQIYWTTYKQKKGYIVLVCDILVQKKRLYHLETNYSTIYKQTNKLAKKGVNDFGLWH